MTLISKTLVNRCYVVLLCFGLLIAAPMVRAQEALTLSVSPTLFEMTASPSQNFSSAVRVINSNSYDVTVYVDTANFDSDGESGRARLLPRRLDATQPNATLAEWVSFEQTSFTIPAEQTREIPFTISVPQEASPGGHYAALMIGTRPPEQDSGPARVETSQVVTSLIFLRVTGEITEAGNIREFRSTNGLVERPATTFELRFENTGNVDIQPQGTITITSPWGAERGEIPVNHRSIFGKTLPGQIRQYSFAWESEWSWIDIGPYTAVATLAYGDDARQFVTSRTTFWVFPWRVIGGTLLIVVLVLWLISYVVKVYIRRVLQQAGVAPTVSMHAVSAPLVRAHEEPSVKPGMLDLRQRFTAVQRERELTLRERLVTHMIVHQRRYFTGVGACLFLFVVGGVWFYGSADRAYEVRETNSDAPLNVTSEDAAYQALASSTANTAPDPTLTGQVRVVNRSGVNGAAAAVRVTLESAGFEVVGLATDLGIEESRTVIVFDPQFEQTALAISEALGGVLLSSFVSDSADTAPITVYVGADAVVE